MSEYLLDLIDRMECDDELPKPKEGSLLEQLVERTVRTEAWKEVRVLDDKELIGPACDILQQKRIRAYVFDNGVRILGYLIKNSNSDDGKDFLANQFHRDDLNNNRLTSLIFSAQLANLSEAKESILACLTSGDYGVLSYSSEFFSKIEDEDGIAKVTELICQNKLGVAQVIKIGNINKYWVIPYLEKIISSREGSKMLSDKECVGYAQKAINEIKV